MSHSYVTNLVHAFFATKERRPIIPDERQEKLWAYFTGIGRNLGFPVLAAAGTGDHAHLLFALDQKIALSTAIQKFKANSSRWMSQHGDDFSWQEGFGAVSVSPSQAPRVKLYVRDQREHPKKRDSRGEFLELLRRAGIAINDSDVI
ncbi:MAG: transposase [Candidatus Koribacter versatilis]|uniref:Transposase n=1 Tax=Candidatus Korobacter versatilis TaxID=658062 RepID=A0A932EP84_9BACT|nr:transposase [Candidatus Koribacter versatilis]